MRTAVAALAAAALTSAVPTAAQVRDIREMNTDQIRALDRAKTAVIIPGGILEEHGPYLPSYADGYAGERLARDRADAVVARPGWTALMFPPIPLGSGGANEIGGKYGFPGTYAVRPATLRAVFMDLAAELGEQGFRWLFIVNDHGSPDHNRMLDHAGGFFERALRVLDGWDPGQDPRYGDTLLKINPAVLGVMQRSRTRDEAMAARQRAWLAAKGLE